MYRTTGHEIATARVADLHRQGQRDALAREARQTPADQRRHPVPGLRAVLARRVLAVLAPRST
jgi:hypothetical protein